MTLIERILCRLFEHVDIIKQVDGKDELYLRRWFIRRGKKGSVYLHHIYRSDDDPDPHDHPWDFKTFILWGGYANEEYDWLPKEKCVESDQRVLERQGKSGICLGPFEPTEVLRIGDYVERKAEHTHQVKLKNGKPAWTLVFIGLYRRDWSFVTPSGPVRYDKYLEITKDPMHYDRVDFDPEYVDEP